MAAGIYHRSFLFFLFDTCLLIKSMACALSCSALCKSARMRVSATFSTERLLHKASSHMTFKRLRAYWGGRGGGGGEQNSSGYTWDAHSSSHSETLSTNQNESACLTSTQMFHSFLFKAVSLFRMSQFLRNVPFLFYSKWLYLSE